MKYAIKASNFLLLCATVNNIVFSQITKAPETVEAETPVPEICEFLIETDKALVEKYKTRPKGVGNEIMAMVREYNDGLASIVRKGMAERQKQINSTFITDQAKSLIEHGGPEFINFYVQKDVLEETFGLNNVSSRILASQRQNTVDIWQDFYKLYSKIKDEDEDESD